MLTADLQGWRPTETETAEAWRSADLARVAALLTENWNHQQALDPGMRTPEMARLEAAAGKAGALGGKAAGAGAGGCMVFVMRGDARAIAATVASASGYATVLPLAWSAEGGPTRWRRKRS